MDKDHHHPDAASGGAALPMENSSMDLISHEDVDFDLTAPSGAGTTKTENDKATTAALASTTAENNKHMNFASAASAPSQPIVRRQYEDPGITTTNLTRTHSQESVVVPPISETAERQAAQDLVFSMRLALRQLLARIMDVQLGLVRLDGRISDINSTIDPNQIMLKVDETLTTTEEAGNKVEETSARVLKLEKDLVAAQQIQNNSEMLRAVLERIEGKLKQVGEEVRDQSEKVARVEERQKEMTCKCVIM
ncbi:unnamed protein product [Amoebophrya sp. A120]|nr:unnamed protein product [Amoebophrya sp. A120]|eukprot:GSA120T00013802001.1